MKDNLDYNFKLTYLNVSGQITDFVKVTAQFINSQIKHW
jgi:hypothetical protein